MPYEEYLATAHMRNGPSSTYFIIPGSTPVIFHDEHGQEMYRYAPHLHASSGILTDLVQSRCPEVQYADSPAAEVYYPG